MKKNKLYILIGIIVLIILIVLIFIFSKIIKKDDFITNNFEISADSNVSKDDFKDLGPISDDSTNMIVPYEFSISNSKDEDSTYNLLIEDIIDKEKGKNTLARKYLNYELKLNDVVIKKGTMSNIKNNILDTRTMAKNVINGYSLKIWLNEQSKETDWMNKYYSYNITVEPIKE